MNPFPVAFILAAPLLSGCVTFHPYTAGDTDCLSSQLTFFHNTWPEALGACGHAVPDLTGDAELQKLARWDHIRFYVDPARDKQLKEADLSHREDEAVYDTFSSDNPLP